MKHLWVSICVLAIAGIILLMGYRVYKALQEPVRSGYKIKSPNKRFIAEAYKTRWFDFFYGDKLRYDFAIVDAANGTQLQEISISRPSKNELPNFMPPRGSRQNEIWAEDSEFAVWWFDGAELSLYPERRKQAIKLERPIDVHTKVFTGSLINHPSNKNLRRLILTDGQGFIDVEAKTVTSIENEKVMRFAGNLKFHQVVGSRLPNSAMTWTATLFITIVSPIESEN